MFGLTGDCPHVEVLRGLRLDPKLDQQKLNDGRCYICESASVNLWLCLHSDCLKLTCSDGATNHSLAHYQRDPSHCLRLSLSSLRIWCYSCEGEIQMSSPPPPPPPPPMPADGGVSLDRGDSPSLGAGCPHPAGRGLGDAKPKGLTGLQNVGNTCYMNAALQALSNTPPLLHHFLSRPPPPPPHSGGGGGGGGAPPLTRAFHRLLHDMWSPKRLPVLAPTSILYGIRTSHPMFRGFHQHDTQEFLRCLMDQLHEEMKTPDLNPPLSTPPRLMCLDSLEQISEGEGGAASSQSEGEEYETCDSGVSERSSLSEEPTGPTPLVHKPNLRSISRTPSPSDDHRRSKSGGKGQQHGSPSKRKQVAYRSIISDIFDGKLISSVQCLTCNRVSTRVETFQDLSLPIPSRDHLTMLHQGSLNTSPTKCAHLYSTDQGWWAWLWDWVCSWFWGPTVGLHDCLSAFFSADELKGDNMYSCEKCSKLRNGVKYSRVLQCPEVLCIHLKRFRHELMFSSKINNYVTFPLEGLDLRPYLHSNCPSEVTTYDLTSVICHHGSAGGGGHYTCFALNAQSQRWYEFDDQSVRQVSSEVVRNCEAYVLFYKKDSTQVSTWRERAARLEESLSSSSDESGAGGDSSSLQSSHPDRYLISRDWVERFNSWGEPGPIENREFLCRHSRVLPEKRPLAIPRPVWSFLHSKFGGGPVVRADEVGPCDTCVLRVLLHEFQRLEESSNGVVYAVSASWLSSWESYLKGQSRDPPGPVDNSALARPNSNAEYCDLTSGQWEMLMKLYGGGPPVPLKDSSESDSRSSDERLSGCDNFDSGVWLCAQKSAGENLFQTDECDTSCELMEVQTTFPGDVAAAQSPTGGGSEVA